MKDLMAKGYTPDQWVVLLKKNLSEKIARKEETEKIHSNGPTKFNRQSGEKQHQAKLTNQQVIDIYKKAHSGQKFYVPDIAKEYKVSRATIYMIINRKQWRTITSGVAIDR